MDPGPLPDSPDAPFTDFPTCPELSTGPGHTVQLGYFFANKPYSKLTPQHGFTAALQLPIPGLPVGCLTGDSYTVGNSAQFRRFCRIKKEWHSATQYLHMPVRCIIDESTSHTLALHSVVCIENDSILDEDEQLELQLSIGDVFLSGKILLGSAEICLIIHEKEYLFSTWVVDKLFPAHEGVHAQIVLGRDFLRYFPGLVLKSVFRGQDAVDLVPWDYNPDGAHNLEINSEGELVVYVYGCSELRVENQKVGKGGFGVFFGQNSYHNMASRCTVEGSPQAEVALMEGIICTALGTILGRWAEGHSSFTSVRIRINSQEIFNIIGTGRALQEYQERNWQNCRGDSLGIREVLQTWAGFIVPELEAGRTPWMRSDMIVFEQVEVKEKGIQAARHLAISSLGSCPAEEIDRGACKATDKEWASSLFTYIELLPSDTRDPSAKHKLFRYPNIDKFIMDRKVASEKEIDALELQLPQAVQIAIGKFFPSKGILDIYAIWRTFEEARTFAAMEILAMSKRKFIEQVIKIGKEKGRLMENFQWEGIGN